MKKQTKPLQENPIKKLRELYNENRGVTLQRAKENLKKRPTSKDNGQAANTNRIKREDLDF